MRRQNLKLVLTNRPVQNMRKLLLKKLKAWSDYKTGSEYEETVAKQKLGLSNRQVQFMRVMLFKLVSPLSLLEMVS